MRRFMVLVTVLGLVGAAFVFPVVGAGAGGGGGGQIPAPVTIKKVALNAPPGTKFTIQLTCDHSVIIPPGVPATVGSLDFGFTVNAAGEAVPDGTNTVGFGNPANCTVTETAAGGAAATSYECADNLADLTKSSTLDPGSAFDPGSTTEPGSTDDAGPDAIVDPPGPFCLSNGPQAGPISFSVESKTQVVTVTVTNTFPVVAPITFTG